MASKKSGGTPPPKKSTTPPAKQAAKKTVEKRQGPEPTKKAEKLPPLGKGMDMWGAADPPIRKRGSSKGGGTEDGGYSVSPSKNK